MVCTNKISLRDQQEAPQDQGQAVQVHAVILLVQKAGEIGVPESQYHRPEEDGKPDIASAE